MMVRHDLLFNAAIELAFMMHNCSHYCNCGFRNLKALFSIREMQVMPGFTLRFVVAIFNSASGRLKMFLLSSLREAK